MTTVNTLSRHDRHVFAALFATDESLTADAMGPRACYEPVPARMVSIQERELSAIRTLSADNPSRERISDAIRILSGIIEEFPDYASAWNNRAQAVRMLVGDDLLELRAAQSTLYPDLCEAIRLASGQVSAITTPQRSARVLAAAHTHRGHLLYTCSKNVKVRPERLSNLPCSLRGFDSTKLESLAAADFHEGGRFGDSIARKMAIQLNPYAKMCGEIVREAMINDMRAQEEQNVEWMLQ